MGPFCKAMKAGSALKTCKKMMYMKHMDRKMDGKMIEKMKEVMKDLMKEKMEKKDLHDHQEHEM